MTYTLTEDDSVKIEYYGIPEQDTVINMTNHSYFNLNGHDSGSITKHLLYVDADAFTRADQESIPTGEIVPVEGTPMDFRQKKEVGAEIDREYEALIFGKGYDHNWCLNNQNRFAKVIEVSGEKSGITMEVYTDLPGVQIYALIFGKGYDHNWCLNNQNRFAKVIEVSGEKSGITMEVYTDLPGVQIYSGNFLSEELGKNGALYKHRQGICFETQYYPDAVNHAWFLSAVCRAGEAYRTATVYKFIS